MIRKVSRSYFLRLPFENIMNGIEYGKRIPIRVKETTHAYKDGKNKK
ncbi:MAG: hypothetical protein IJT96_08225 [Lachnospiraceae bacterium]|nr:hypothetical protein [Lachnospiraceae bacterium]